MVVCDLLLILYNGVAGVIRTPLPEKEGERICKTKQLDRVSRNWLAG